MTQLLLLIQKMVHAMWTERNEAIHEDNKESQNDKSENEMLFWIKFALDGPIHMYLSRDYAQAYLSS